MKCVLSIRVNQNLTDFINREPGVQMPPSFGYHCALWGFEMDKPKESELIKTLKRIRVPPFEMSVRDLGFIGNPRIFVLKLNQTPELGRLHREVITSSRDFAKNKKTFDAQVLAKGLDNYSPLIAVPGVGMQRIQNNYDHVKIPVETYELFGKHYSTWTKLSEFSLRA